MRILIVDYKGLALDWIMRCQQDGHQIKWYVGPSEKEAWIGKNICKRIDDPRDWYRWADLIVFSDNAKWMREADQWKKEGWPVVAAGIEGAEWEMDRNAGMQIFKKAGIKTAASKTFSDYDPAIAYVKKEMRRFVSKPCGDATKDMSYCAKTPEDLVYMLERWKKNSKIKGEFILQEFIGGTEMAVGGWFGPGGFSRGWCENFEFKKLMNDELGVATGEQGTVLRYVTKSKLADKVLKPIEPMLEKLNYVGYIDVNCIIDDEGTPWPLEFTIRFGWPTFNIQQSLHTGDHAEWLANLAEGKDSKNFTLDQVATGVVMSIPDYPYSHLTRKEVIGIPLYGLDPAIADQVHPCEMMMGEAPHQVAGKIIKMPCLVSAGDYILISTGTGETINLARKEAYRVLKKLTMPNSPMYRTDIGYRLKKQLPEIQKFGYADNLNF